MKVAISGTGFSGKLLFGPEKPPNLKPKNMLIETLNKALIAAMREKIPAGVNLAGVLMDTLYIGKEAVYRRLRSEVPFTLAEAATISRKMGISLDRLLGTACSDSALFRLHLIQRGNPVETYGAILDHYTKMLHRIQETRASEVATLSHTFPQTFYLRHEALARFLLFKWICLHGEADTAPHFEALELPGKLVERQREFAQAAQQIKSTCHILSPMAARRLADDIRYFASARLIGKNQVALLRKEALELLRETEETAAEGRFGTGNPVQLFVSDVDFEATCGYVEAGIFQAALVRIFEIDSVTSQDPEVFASVKREIKTFKTLATPISGVAGKQRAAYFAQQREWLAAL